MTDCDQHLVVHDLIILGISVGLGIASAVMTGSVLMFGVILVAVFFVGISLMRIDFTRRKINHRVMNMARKKSGI